MAEEPERVLPEEGRASLRRVEEVRLHVPARERDPAVEQEHRQRSGEHGNDDHEHPREDLDRPDEERDPLHDIPGARRLWIVTTKLIAPASDDAERMWSERIQRSWPLPGVVSESGG